MIERWYASYKQLQAAGDTLDVYEGVTLDIQEVHGVLYIRRQDTHETCMAEYGQEVSGGPLEGLDVGDRTDVPLTEPHAFLGDEEPLSMGNTCCAHDHSWVQLC